MQLLLALLKPMYFHIASAVGGPFESKEAYLYTAVAVDLLWKHGNFLMAVAIGGLFESALSLLTHYICHLGRAVASGGPVLPVPPIWNRFSPISRLAPQLLHTSSTVFLKCGPPSGLRPPLLLNPGEGLHLGHFENVGLTHYSSYCVPFESRVLAQCNCCWETL